MVFIMSTIVTIIQAALFLWVFTVIPGIPPYVEFDYEEIEPPLSLVGPLSINNKLNNAERLFENEIKGPEGFDVYNNDLFMSVHGGKILKLSNKILIPILRTGKPCQGLWEERLCGRPLGLKFDQNGGLFIADAYYGILKANLSTGETTTLVSMTEHINGKVPMLPNAIDVGRDGTVYWSDSSTTHRLDDGLFIILSSGTGRLLKYDPKTKSNVVLMDGLHFANGVTLSMDESFVLVAESAKYRIWKYHLKGKKAGTKEVFVDRLPGIPDNIRRNEKGGFFVSIITQQGDDILSMRTLSEYPSIRKLISRIMATTELFFEFMNSLYPNVSWMKAIHWIGHFESFKMLYKDHVVIVLLDQNGQISGSLHATDGNVKTISDIIPFKGHYFLGSPYNPFLGMVEIK